MLFFPLMLCLKSLKCLHQSQLGKKKEELFDFAPAAVRLCVSEDDDDFMSCVNSEDFN